MVFYKNNLSVGLLLLVALVSSAIAANEEAPPKIGNFALPSPQQPGSFLSLGQNVLGAKRAQLSLFADNLSGKNQHFSDIIPGVLYGITDKFSVFFNVPFAASYQEGDQCSSGVEDIFLQFEYAYYARNTSEFSEQATVLAFLSFPSGSTEKEPPNGIGSSSFLMGTTYSLIYSRWYGFISPGALLTTSKNQTKFGNRYFYQMGVGRNLYSKPSSWILSALLEINGQYSEKDKIQGEINNGSGGNTILLTPSLWFSTSKLILQLGIGFPIIQHLFGEQNKHHYLLAASLRWTL